MTPACTCIDTAFPLCSGGGTSDRQNGAAPGPDVGLDDFEALLASVGIPTGLAGNYQIVADLTLTTCKAIAY